MFGESQLNKTESTRIEILFQTRFEWRALLRKRSLAESFELYVEGERLKRRP